MKNFLTKFDFLGATASFHVNSKRIYTSWKGGLTLLIFFTISAIYFLNEFNDWIYLVHNTKSFSLSFNNLPSLNLQDSSQFMIAICNGNEDNSSYLDPVMKNVINETLQWKYMIRTNVNYNGSINIPITDCSRNNFPPKMITKNDFKRFQNCKCVDNSELANYNMSYFITDSYSTFFSYEFKFNQSIYENLTLYNYYYNYFKKNPLKNTVYFIDSVINIDKSNDDAVCYFMNYQQSYVNPDFTNIYDIYMRNNSVELDDRIFDIGKTNVKYGISYDKSSYYFKFSDDKLPRIDRSFVKMNFRASTTFIEMKRTRVKLDEVFGKIMSVISIFLLVFYFLSSKIDEFESKKKTISNIFKGFETNKIMMKKIRIIQEDFNEVEYKNNPNFNTEVNINSKKDHLENKLEINNSQDMFNKDNKKNKIIEIEIRENVERKSNNDPISSKKYDKDLEALKKISTINEIANKHGFRQNWTDFICSCKKKQKIREKFFLNACSLYYYYLDITTYFKKMMEIDIIKFYLFSKSERNLISILSNPDFSVNKEEFERKLELQYKKFNEEKFENRVEFILKNVLNEGRNNAFSNKLMKLIQNGNQFILDY